MILEAIHTAIEGKDLPFETAFGAMDQIMKGEATNAQIASYLTALRMKGESIEEITASAAVMRQHCTKLVHENDVLEIVGTGGDCAFTFNISTVSAFVLAASGVPVAKHGNRSVSSKCGSADLLEALGAKIDITAEQSGAVLKQTGMCFMFAPVYHAAMRFVIPVRKEIATRTLFNIIGPLANPAGATIQLLGVYDQSLVVPLARTLNNLGVKRAMVVYGRDGLDEITLSDNTVVCEVNNGTLSEYELNPAELGLSFCGKEDLIGGDTAENAVIAKEILSGVKGAKRDIVLLNSAACLYLAGKADSIGQGVKLAAEAIDSGKAIKKLEQFVTATNEVAE